MQLSGHYPKFSKKTLLVLTNNELAKILAAEEREVTEIDIVTTPDLEPVERITTTGIGAVQDIDAAKQHRRDELYHAISERLQRLMTKEKFVDIILCVPEANKNQLLEALHTDVGKHVKTVVPKNLANMDLGQVMRILFET